MVSLRDIAEEVGVSISLVSKVLNGRMGTTGIRPDLEEKIRRRARELNYHKNRSALALLNCRQDVIGVFIHREGRSGSGIIEAQVDGISGEATRHGKRQILGFFHDLRAFTDLCKFAHRGVMDGLLVGGITHADLKNVLLEIIGSGLPVVTMMQEQVHPRVPNVAVDQVAVGRLGTQHLIAAGCRRIGHIRDFEDRFAGYRRALAAARLPYDARLVFGSDSNFGYAKGCAAARYFLSHGIELDGLFAQSDEEAVGAMNVLCDAGWDIPGRLRIVGVDNAPYAEFSRVPLTSVSQSGQERGRVAVQILLAAIDKQPVKSARIAPELIVRASTGGRPRATRASAARRSRT